MSRFFLSFIFLFLISKGFSLESKVSSFFCPYGCHDWYSEKARETEKLFMNALKEATFIGDYAYYFYRTGKDTISLEDSLAIKNRLIHSIWLSRIQEEGLFIFNSYPEVHWFVETEGEEKRKRHVFYREVFPDSNQSNYYILSQYADILDITCDLEKDVIGMIESLSADQAKTFLKRSRFPYFQNFLHASIDCFRKIHQDCAANHEAPFAFFQKALMYLHEEGDHLRAIEKMDEIYKRIDMQTFEDAALASLIGRSKGEAQNQLAFYLEGIKTLGLAIERDPNNQEAHLEQAIAYFELGDFEKSLVSFSEVEQPITPIDFEDILSLEFASGLIKGVISGSVINLVDFVPSMLSSLRGLSFGLWAFVSDPIEVSKELVSASRAMIRFIQTHEMLDVVQVMIPEIKELRSQGLSAERKGELFEQIIGRFGTDFLIFAGATKGMKLFKNLRRANATLTLEKMTKGVAKKEALIKASDGWWKKTSSAIEEIKISKGKVGDKLYKAFKGEHLSELQVRKILHQAGFKTFPRPKGIPQNWKVKVSKNGGGMRYRLEKLDKSGKMCAKVEVRVMPGDPCSPFPMQQKPYIKHSVDGKFLDKYGNILSKEAPECHIPLYEYNFETMCKCMAD